MIPDSRAPGIVIRAPDKTSARESGDEASLLVRTASFASALIEYCTCVDTVLRSHVRRLLYP